jgi:hypothetical protein
LLLAITLGSIILVWESVRSLSKAVYKSILSPCSSLFAPSV